MSRLNVKIGDRFGEWATVSKATKDRFGHRRFLCRCSCGKASTTPLMYLRSGRSTKCRSCACKNRVPNSKHGLTNHTLYRTWCKMKHRGHNKNADNYKYYGGRGITVCDRWLSSFPNFLEDMGERPEGLTLDRINNDGNYEPSNCMWATKREQSNNQRIPSTNISGTVGVSWDKRLGSWRATIHISGKQKHLGNFKDKEDAVVARKDAEGASR